MSRFVIVTDGVTPLNVRTDPGTNHPLVASMSRLPVGDEFSSREVRNVGSGSSRQRWHRVGTNRWVCEFSLNGNSRNCLEIQSGWTIRTPNGDQSSSTRFRVINVPASGLNVRSAPIVTGLKGGNWVMSLANNTNHNWSGQGAVDPNQPSQSTSRVWIRMRSGRWVVAHHVCAPTG